MDKEAKSKKAKKAIKQGHVDLTPVSIATAPAHIGTPRIGRPMRTPKKGEKRLQLGLKVRAEVKRLVDAEATRTGWAQSQVAETLIEKQIAHQETLAALGLDPDKVQQDLIERLLGALGWETILVNGKKAFRPPSEQEPQQ